jgi:hypothetical protein
MASQIKVDQIAGAAGNTITVPAGQTLDVLGTLDIDGGTLVLPNTVVTTTGTQTLTNKTLTTPVLTTPIANAGIQLKNGATSAGFLEFFEDSDNGTNKVTLIGPAASADVTVTLPAATDTLVGKNTTDTLTNKTVNASQLVDGSIATGKLADDSVTLAKMAPGTDGNLISYDASGNPVAVATGNAAQVLTSAGAGAPPVFADAAGGGTDWQAVKTGNFTAVAGEGYFINTTGGAIEMDLPAGSIGDEVAFIDYAGTFDTNALTIDQNGTEKIAGSTDPLTVSVERAANTLVYTDGTQGWLLKNK